MKFTHTTTSKAVDGEEVYLYTNEQGKTVKFQADPKQAFVWLFYPSSTAPRKLWNKLVDEFIRMSLDQYKFPGGHAEATKTLTIA